MLVVTFNPTLCKLALKKNNKTREIRTKNNKSPRFALVT